MEGKVIFFSAKKGWGFISQENGQPDLFVHFSSLKMNGYKKLEQDQKVEFEIEKGPTTGKDQAANVTVID